MRPTLRRKLGRGGAAAAVIGVVALIATLLVQAFMSGGDSAEVQAFAQRRGSAPAEHVVSAAGARRVIVIGDVTGHAGPKRIAADVLSALAGSRGVDALVVDVDSAHQQAFDRYTATTPEDASILTRRAGLLPAGDDGRHALELYRAVWALNERLGPDRRIRIIAAAPGPWPPPAALPPTEAARLFADRGRAMAERVSDQLLDRTSTARAVALVDPLQALRGGGTLRVRGGGMMPVEWFAAALAQRYPVDVYSALPDAQGDAGRPPVVARYAGTELLQRVRRALPREALGLPIEGPLLEAQDPVLVETGPGVTLAIEPEGATLSDLANGYLFLP